MSKLLSIYLAAASSQEIRDKLSGILSSNEFTKPAEKTSLLKHLADWLREQVQKYLKNLKLPDTGANKLFNLDGMSPAGRFALNAAGIAILTLFIVGLLYFIFRNLRFSKSLKQKEDALLLTTLKDPEKVEQKAMECCNRGDFRQGIRFLYIAFLLRLNELNIIKIDKSKTNKQYLNEMLNSGLKAYEPAAGFTHAFNEYWYGNVQMDREKFDFWYRNYTFLMKEGNI